jgi:hypothetical protein
MTVAAPFVRCPANFSRVIVLPRMFVATFLALAASGVADARSGAGGYDGIWNVLIVTEAGSCDPAYRYPFQVAGGRITSAGAASVTGSVGRGGGVKVRISAAGSVATGSGRLASRSGTGRWSARLSGGICSGRWEASRGM